MEDRAEGGAVRTLTTFGRLEMDSSCTWRNMSFVRKNYCCLFGFVDLRFNSGFSEICDALPYSACGDMRITRVYEESPEW